MAAGRPPAGEALNFFGRRFVVGDTAGLRTEPLKEDLDEIASVVRNASRLADLTLVTIHAHEGHMDRLLPAQFLVTFARAMVEAGADLFVGHGPHVLRGIEIYKGKPILYSLGDFIFQNETLLRLPSENYETYGLGAGAHVADFNDRRYDHDQAGSRPIASSGRRSSPCLASRAARSVSCRCTPSRSASARAVPSRGRPQLAEGELAAKILE